MSEFARGWPLVAAAFIGVGAGVGSAYLYSQGLFLKPLAAEFGWSRGAASLGFLAGTLGGVVAAGPTGLLMDRFGAVRTALGSLLLLSMAFAALGIFTQGLVSFVLLSGLLALTTVGTTPLPYSRLIIAVFDRHRGFALGLAVCGAGAGAILTPNLLGPLIAVHGWRAGYVALAIVVASAIIPVALLLRNAPATAARRQSSVTVTSIAHDRGFAILALTILLASAGALGAVVHFAPLLSDRGLAPARVGPILGLIGVTVIIGRATTGFLLDRLPSNVVACFTFAISAAGVWLVAAGSEFYWLGALALGLSVGSESNLMAYFVSRLVPPTAYGAAYGMIFTVFLIGTATGPALLGAVFDYTHSYTLPFVVSGACLSAASMCALLLPGRKDAAEPSTP